MSMRFLLLMWLAAGPALWAQSGAGTTVAPQHREAAPTLLNGPSFVVLADAGCPVAVTAERTGKVAVRDVDGSETPSSGRTENQTRATQPSEGQELTLSFKAFGRRSVVEASVEVHGWSASMRMFPVAGRRGAEGENDEVIEHFRLKPRLGLAGLDETRLQTRKMIVVRWIEVTRLRYADGGEWHASTAGQCRVSPSLFELVGAGR